MKASGRLSAEPGRGRRAGVLAGLALAAALLHMALLGGLRWTWDAPVPLARPAPAVRLVPVGSPPMPPVAGGAPPRNLAAAAATPPPLRSGVTPKPARPKRGGATTPPAADASIVPAAAPSPVPPSSEADDDAPPPVYRTRMPPPVSLRYAVRRGPVEGGAELHWRPAADGYALDAAVRIGDVAVLTQSSRGRIDSAGVAPLRFVDARPSRAAAAVNFERDAGRIRFSRKAADAPLLPGAQDRLSWIVQMAAIVAAEPALRQSGAEIRMAVAGAGGDAAVWRFRCLGEEPVETDAGIASASHYLREAAGPYGLRAEIWIGADVEGALPLRAAWRSGPTDDGLDLRLRAASVPAAE